MVIINLTIKVIKLTDFKIYNISIQDYDFFYISVSAISLHLIIKQKNRFITALQDRFSAAEMTEKYQLHFGTEYIQPPISPLTVSDYEIMSCY